MTAWLNPAAFWLLAVAVLPVLIHLLLRRQSLRVPFPTLRFIVASDQSAMRLHRPSDVTLLIVRVGIIVCAALAVTRPLQLTDKGRDAWMARSTRALVVDTSASVNRARAIEAAAAEIAGASVTRRFDASSLAEGVGRASAWLAQAEPGSREIVVVSDFQLGALTQNDVERIPPGMGIRMVRVDTTAIAGAEIDAGPVVHQGRAFERMVSPHAEQTGVRLRPLAAPAGLEIEGPPEATDKVRAAVAAAGSMAPSPEQPIVVRFGKGRDSQGVRWTEEWMRDAAARLLATPYAAVIGLRVSARDRTLVVDVDAAADSLAAAQVTQAALNARQDPEALTDREPAQIPATVLTTWTRPPGPPDAEAWRNSTESDGRWLWLAALILMTLETLLRRQRTPRAVQTEAHAA